MSKSSQTLFTESHNTNCLCHSIHVHLFYFFNLKKQIIRSVGYPKCRLCFKQQHCSMQSDVRALSLFLSHPLSLSFSFPLSLSFHLLPFTSKVLLAAKQISRMSLSWSLLCACKAKAKRERESNFKFWLELLSSTTYLPHHSTKCLFPFFISAVFQWPRPTAFVTY